MPTRKFTSLQDYMERTGSTARDLLAQIFKATGVRISESMFSYMLRGSRRISNWNALAISAVTGIPIEVLTKWPKVADSDKGSGKRQNPAA